MATQTAAAPPGGSRSRVAIVFEHAGANLAQVEPIYAMHRPFGLGIFPHMRYSAQIAREAASHGLVPMLHLPLESRDPADVGPLTGIVWVRMTDPEIARVVDDDLASVPGVVGVSNHAGSRALTDRRVMRDVLGAVKTHGLWFDENPNAPVSVAPDIAGRLGLHTVRVTAYLDVPPNGIEGKVRALIATAQRRGWAIAAGHVDSGAPQVVRRLLPEFDRAGIKLVPITEFLTGTP